MKKSFITKFCSKLQDFTCKGIENWLVSKWKKNSFHIFMFTLAAQKTFPNSHSSTLQHPDLCWRNCMTDHRKYRHKTPLIRWNGHREINIDKTALLNTGHTRMQRSGTDRQWWNKATKIQTESLNTVKGKIRRKQRSRFRRYSKVESKCRIFVPSITRSSRP